MPTLLEVGALFEKINKVLGISEFLVFSDKSLKVVWVDDHFKSTQSSKIEFFVSDASKANSFPYFGDIGFFRSIIGRRIILEHDVSLGKSLLVAILTIENFSWLVELALEASVSYAEDIGLVRFRDKVFNFSIEFVTTLGI